LRVVPASQGTPLNQPTQTVISGSGPVAPEWGGSLLASLLEIAIKVITKG
jgi:hypothetical protein